MVAVLGAALGPVIVALIREATGSYDALVPAIIWIPVAVGVAALLVSGPGARMSPRAS